MTEDGVCEESREASSVELAEVCREVEGTSDGKVDTNCGNTVAVC